MWVQSYYNMKYYLKKAALEMYCDTSLMCKLTFVFCAEAYITFQAVNFDGSSFILHQAHMVMQHSFPKGS
jgi:hypothetical protein